MHLRHYQHEVGPVNSPALERVHQVKILPSTKEGSQTKDVRAISAIFKETQYIDAPSSLTQEQMFPDGKS